MTIPAEIKHAYLRCTLPTGVLSMSWPELISVEDAETMKELVELQVSVVLRNAKRREEAPLPPPPDAKTEDRANG